MPDRHLKPTQEHPSHSHSHSFSALHISPQIFTHTAPADRLPDCSPRATPTPTPPRPDPHSTKRQEEEEGAKSKTSKSTVPARPSARPPDRLTASVRRFACLFSLCGSRPPCFHTFVHFHSSHSPSTNHARPSACLPACLPACLSVCLWSCPPGFGLGRTGSGLGCRKAWAWSRVEDGWACAGASRLLFLLLVSNHGVLPCPALPCPALP